MKPGSFNHLQDILKDNNYLVIPDLQRDYCWGHIEPKTTNVSLAYTFCKELLENAKKMKPADKAEFSYGIIYTYEYPETFFYLCDGQQRLTTLYLIIGVLNYYLNDERLKNLIVNKNHQPRLKYEVRTSTDYFINDLVCNVFLCSESGDIGQLRQAPWFRKEFEDDPSVKSIVDAITSIKSLINKEEAAMLADYILNSVGFVYINLKANDNLENDTYTKVREYGEKMYEIVNTSGDPMEPNEHLKANLLSQLPDEEKAHWTEKWEMWQDFFWQNRGYAGVSPHESADEGFNEFIKWIKTIKGQDKKIESAEEIEEYFKALFLLYNIEEDIINYRKASIFKVTEKLHFSSNAKLVVIFPALVFFKNTDLVSFSETGYSVIKESVNLEQIYRFLRFFSNLSKYSSANTGAASLAGKLKPGDDITNLINYRKEFPSLVSDEEAFKLELYKQSNHNERRILEDIFWQAEDHDLMNGKIAPVFNWMGVQYDSTTSESFSIESFQVYFNAFNSLFESDKILEKVRIFMLAYHNNWIVFREGDSKGTTRYYLGSHNDKSFWRNKIYLDSFTAAVEMQKEGNLTDKIVSDSIMNLENVENRKIVRKIKSEADKHWQWNNNKRFFVIENVIYFPNGVQAKGYTKEIEF